VELRLEQAKLAVVEGSVLGIEVVRQQSVVEQGLEPLAVGIVVVRQQSVVEQGLGQLDIVVVQRQSVVELGRNIAVARSG